MSKVYEALRQRDMEDPAIRETNGPSESGFSSEPHGIQPELGIGDRTLQAVFLDSDDEPAYFDEPAASRLTKQQEQASHATEGFPHLQLTGSDDSRLVFHSDPRGLAAEQYRMLRRNLEQKFPKGAVLLMTSPAPQDGKTLSAANLCSCLGDSGRSALLLELDLRQPSLRKLLRVTDSVTGIEMVLAGSAQPEAAVRFVEDLALHVAMVASAPPNPSHLVRGAGMRTFIAWARTRFDWVVVDGPPVFPAADVAELSSFADALLMVVRARSTPRNLISKTVDLLGGSRLFGVVLNEANIESNSYYQY